MMLETTDMAMIKPVCRLERRRPSCRYMLRIGPKEPKTKS
jgi:hypothetical protein